MPVLLLIVMLPEGEEIAPLAAIAPLEEMVTIVEPVTAATEMTLVPVLL